MYNQNETIETSYSDSEVKMAAVQKALFKNVYVWMTGALLLSAFMALAVSGSYTLINLIYGHVGVFIGLLIAEIAVVIIFSARLDKLSFGAAATLFALYSALNGVTMASIFVVYDLGSIASVFFITAGTFGVMSFIGAVTKKDLSSWGNILIMGVVGLIIASVVNLFLRSEWLYWVVSFVGVLIFTGLTAYDTQKIKSMLANVDADNASAGKIALWGALELYLDFINLFLYLLRLFGRRR